MAQQIKLKRSAVSGKAPLTTDVALGELAINTFDGKMYFKRDNGTASMLEVSTVGHTHALSSLTGVSISSPSTNQVLQYNGTNWVNATVAGSGTVTSVALSGGTTGLTVTGSPITTSGTFTLATTTPAKTSATTTLATTEFVKRSFATQGTGGTLDWNDGTNLIPGVGPTLLLGNATNGPTPSVGNYFHPLNIEYAGVSGSGNVTQLAISYGSPGNDMWMRGKYAGTWTSWIQFLNSANLSSYATSTNTASKLVTRDASGNFSAGTITASLTGNASTATTLATGRTLTVGNTGKSFNGSSDLSWSLAEIGAVSAGYLINRSIANADNADDNGVTFNYLTAASPISPDSALMTMAYSNAWAWQLAGDWRTGTAWMRGQNNTTWQSWRQIVDSSNYPTYFNNQFNNSNETHSTRTSFDATTPSYGFGWRFIQGSTNGPGTGGNNFYSLYTGLGTEYPATGAGSYGMYLAIDRNSATPYLSVRFNENNSLGTWRKIQAGNADTATTLQTARTINGTSFNGSANITTNSWGTSRTLSFTGDVTGSSAVDGSANVATAMTLANSGVTAGTHTKVTVDAKGRVTAGTTLAATDIPNLDASKITSGVFDQARLPSYVDDVLEYANLASFPGTGETGKIYVALDTNKTYRWSGSAYIYITSGAVDSVAGKTGVVTLVKGDVGLGNVDNTADASKNVATAATWTTARTISLNGDLSGSASVNGSANVTITTAIGDNTVTNTDLRDSAALSVIGRSANSSGDPADIAAGTDGHVLRRSGTTLDFGTIATAGIANGAITPEKLSGAQTGSAPIYGARAWVNFNGTGTPAIRASGNVSSITDLGDTGQYRVNFTTAFSDADYVMTGVANNFNYGQSLNVGLSYGASSQGSFNAGGTTRRNKTTALCEIIFGIGNSTARYDPYEAMLTFYR